MQRNGIVMTSVGGGLVAVGAIFSAIHDSDDGTFRLGSYVFETDGDNSNLRNTGVVSMIAGAACLSVGLPVMIVGAKKKKQTLRDFKNQYYLSQQPLPYFQVNISPNSVGIAYKF